MVIMSLKKIVFGYLIILLIACSQIVQCSVEPSKHAVLIYNDIKKVVDRECAAGTYQKNFTTSPLFTGKVFLETADACVTKMKEKLNAASWLSGGTQEYYFVRKLILPANSEIEFRGDLHGDVRSLIYWLEDLQAQGWLDKENIFKLNKKDRYLAFLGDYTDRGHYGAEVMYIIMQLLLHNPDNILLVRGNHEDWNINLSPHVGGFINELVTKFGLGFRYGSFLWESPAQRVTRFYNYLPVCLFLGCHNAERGTYDFIQCCHGGMEPLYNSQPLLADAHKDLYEWLDKRIEEDRSRVPCVHDKVRALLNKCGCNKQYCLNNGFQWNDFDFFNTHPDGTWEFKPGRGRLIHKKLATEILQHAGGKHNVWAVFRAHQHDGNTVPHILKYGNGIYKLWSETTIKAQDWGSAKNSGNIQWTGECGEPVPLEKYSVWTFNVAPRTGVYEKCDPAHFTYDTVARLTLKSGFDNWVLQPRQIYVG